MYECKILADSLNMQNKCRLTTFQITFPRFILAEYNTHKLLCRNAASSRAIPVEKRIEAVINDPFVPDFGYNKKGMQAGEMLSESEQKEAKSAWLDCMRYCIDYAKKISSISEKGVHKQWVNRLIEPFSWVTVITSGTEWSNFFKLRCHEDAQPEFRIIATTMKEVYLSNIPKPLNVGDWHIPMVYSEDNEPILNYCQNNKIDKIINVVLKVSAARCARVSYLTHEGKRDISADIDLYDRLISSGHYSPTEHQGLAVKHDKFYVNFKGFKQFRKFIEVN